MNFYAPKFRVLVKEAFFLFMVCFLCGCSDSEKVSIFSTSEISQISFAASELESSIKDKYGKVELLSLSDFDSHSNGTNIVLVTKLDSSFLSGIDNVDMSLIRSLEDQDYTIQTIKNPNKTFLIVGGNANGAMYGGLQLAEECRFQGLKEVNITDSPDIRKRGIKFNIPFDKRSPTYYGSRFGVNTFKGTSTRNAIAQVWDITFWEKWFDQMARFRYNAISLWSLHPFTSLIKLEEYPEVALQNVEGFDGYSKKMTIDEKIDFWKQVMVLAKNRGFEVYFYNWNIYTYGATDKYGIDNDPHNEKTKTYFRKCISKLFETYPDLTGFGVTAGENTGGLTNDEEVDWVMETYGKGFIDFATANKDRNIVFIQRYHDTNAKAVVERFESFASLPNVELEFSFKYAVAHIYSTVTPNWIRTRYGDIPSQLKELNRKTWLELRNDDFYHLHWGDPEFVKQYLSNVPERAHILQGYFMGSDGYTPTIVFNSKNKWAQNKLEIERQWYTFMLWGRLGYDLSLSSNVFQQCISNKYPLSNAAELFEAWSLASKGIPLFTELVQGAWKADWNWYPEACSSLSSGFRTIDDLISTFPPPGSNLCSIRETAENICGEKTSALEIADNIEEYATEALTLLADVNDQPKGELETNKTNLKAMATLSLYYAYKIRGAVSKSSNNLQEAELAMKKASELWLSYSNLMNNMFTGMDLQRSKALTNWHMMDSLVLKEYEDLVNMNEKSN